MTRYSARWPFTVALTLSFLALVLHRGMAL